MDFWAIERGFVESGVEPVCGVDEAGRGPLAGPVFAAAVILPYGIDIPDLNDSKKLTEKTRDKLYSEIIETAIDYGIGTADHKEIDEHNILKATFLAMNRAVDALRTKPGIALVDGNRDPLLKCRSRCIVGGDSKSASIAAASILAKVSRDRFMEQIAVEYPQYAFEKHKGYGTKLHYEKLLEYGPSEIHRATFLKKLKMENGKWKISDGQDALEGTDRTDTRRRGKWGETRALEYLNGKNYTTVAEAYRSRFGEIDLIVKNREFIVFVEVKLRKNDKFAAAREHVDKEKQRKISAAAKLWLQSNRTNLQPRFDVVEVYMPDEFSAPEIIHIENAF